MEIKEAAAISSLMQPVSGQSTVGYSVTLHEMNGKLHISWSQGNNAQIHNGAVWVCKGPFDVNNIHWGRFVNGTAGDYDTGLPAGSNWSGAYGGNSWPSGANGVIVETPVTK